MNQGELTENIKPSSPGECAECPDMGARCLSGLLMQKSEVAVINDYHLTETSLSD
jgi:hypothetical protein